MLILWIEVLGEGITREVGSIPKNFGKLTQTLG